MPLDCANCTPESRQCTLDQFVAALNEPHVLLDDMMGVMENGKFRPLTPEEESELGIKHLEPFTGQIEGNYPLYGKPKHCQLRLEIRRRQ